MRAIDVHTHPTTIERFAAFQRYMPANERLFRRKIVPKTEEEMAEDFRREDVVAMMIAFDAQTATRQGIITNDFVAGLTTRWPDVFLPGWACVDPWKGKAALYELERAITKLGLIGAKWQPPVQAFYPNDRALYPFWDLLQSLNAPTLIHIGMTAVGFGEPGGDGVKNMYGRPIPAIDEIAADFPKLTIIQAHPGWPWSEEAVANALHKGNVYLDISGWRPRYIPQSVKHEMSRRLQDKVLFGSDYPGWSPGQCLDELEMEGFKPPIIEKLFVNNARRILKLDKSLEKAEEAGRLRNAAGKTDTGPQ